MKMHLQQSKKSHSAFTIVELLIVIVVIGILAAITIVAYNGIQTRARQSSLKSDLATAASQLGQLNATDGRYPSNITSLKKSDTTHYDYTYEEATNSYCITATHTQTDVGAFHRINGGPIQEGACSGHEGSTPGGGTETYAVGDTGPAGGVVFYDKGELSDGWRYLEAGTDVPAYNSYTVGYGCSGISTETAIGTGRSNTLAILSNCYQDSGSPGVVHVADYTQGGFDDWFIPSRDELEEMVRYGINPAGQNFMTSGEDYLSSSLSADLNDVWAFYFQASQYRNPSLLPTDFMEKVHPIRSF